MLTLLLALALQPADLPAPPRTVNGQIIGTAEEFRTMGPARVCLLETSVDLLEGEAAYLDYLGIHAGAIRVVGPRGTFLVREGDAWAEPRGGHLGEDWRGRTIARHRQNGRPRYLIYAASDYGRDGESPRTWVEGDALGRSRDRTILDRINVHPGKPAGCQRRFGYGWDSISAAGEDE